MLFWKIPGLHALLPTIPFLCLHTTEDTSSFSIVMLLEELLSFSIQMLFPGDPLEIVHPDSCETELNLFWSKEFKTVFLRKLCLTW